MPDRFWALLDEKLQHLYCGMTEEEEEEKRRGNQMRLRQEGMQATYGQIRESYEEIMKAAERVSRRRRSCWLCTMIFMAVD